MPREFNLCCLVRIRLVVRLAMCKRKARRIMNKNIKTILTAATMALATGCVTAGTWVNGYYIDGPLCTVCDGTRILAHTYGTTICTHCNGTGIEPPEPVVASTFIVDTWCPPPPRWHHRRPAYRPVHRPPPSRIAHPTHRGGGRPAARPAPRPTPRPASRPAARPAGGRGGRR